MTLSTKLALVSIVALVGAAAPASAQSFSAGRGTGNVLPYSIAPVHNSNVSPYAMARTPSVDIRKAPGGSAGYERLLATH